MDDPDTRRRIETLCEDAGLPVAEVRHEGDVLVLVPATLDSLPRAETLQTLADRIEELGFRYVAFSVESEQ